MEKSIKNYSDFLKHIEKGRLYPSYFFFGDEDYLKEEALASLRKKVKESSSLVLWGEEFDIQELFNFLNSFNILFGEGRILIIKEVERLRQNQKEAVISLIEGLLSEEKSDKIAVLIASQGVEIQSNKFLLSIQKMIPSFRFNLLGEREAVEWIQNFAQEHGKKISYSSALFLLSAVGEGLYNLKNELEKIFLQMHGENEISTEKIQDLVPSLNLIQYNISELANALKENRRENVFKIIKNFLLWRIEPSRIIANLAYFYLTKARENSEEECLKRFRYLYTADLELKTTTFPKEIVLNKLLYKLMN